MARLQQSAKVDVFQVKADDSRVVPMKRQPTPNQVRPVQGQGGHPRSVQRAGHSDPTRERLAPVRNLTN